MGFRKQAVPVQIDPKYLFYYSSGERAIPEFRNLIRIETMEAIEQLTVNNNSKTRWNSQITPSFHWIFQKYYWILSKWIQQF